jgi:membrane protease YdiL (CAAX protease family)
VLSALIFGVVHIIPQQAINAALVGVILGGIYVVTESMPAVIILHAINNGLSYLQYVTNPDSDGTMRGLLADDMSYRQVYIASCVFLIISILLIVWLCRRHRSKSRVVESASAK